MEYFERGVQVLNPNVKTFHTSCTTGEGLDAWADWLVEQASK
jgi:Ni2+-binding GTPase involved in maturation of urease and hydrogenase